MPTVRRELLLAALALTAACAPQGETASIDLVRELELAEVLREVPVIDFGTPAARRHMVSGWSHDERDAAGRGFVWSSGGSSTLELYVDRRRDLRLRLHAFPLLVEGAEEQRIAVSVNGHDAWSVVFDGGAQGARGHAVTLPQEHLVAGVNRLRFDYAHTIVPAEVGIGADRRELAIRWDSIEVEGVAASPIAVSADVEQRRLTLPLGSRVDYHLLAPRGAARLSFDALELPPDLAARLDVWQEDHEGRRRIGSFERPGAGEAELRVEPGRPVRLSLHAAAEGDVRPAAQLVVGAPRLDVVRPAGGPQPVPLSAVEPVAATPRRPNILVYVVDALRRDHLTTYGYPLATSPQLDRFAAEATVFEDAVAESPWTRASVASLLTGLLPPQHGAEDRGEGLAAPVATLAELLSAAGYRTGGVTVSGEVAAQLGFAQGFDSYEQVIGDSRLVAYRALAWLESTPAGEPWFLFVHTGDPDVPYRPPADFRQRFAPGIGDPEVGSATQLGRLRAERVAGPPDLVEKIVALYDAEVAANDDGFGFLVEELKRRDQYEDTGVVFVSDHGVEFLDHGSWGHGHTLYRELIDIPLLIRLPGAPAGAGRRVSGVGQLSDVLPTLLDYLDLAAPAEVAGKSLLPYLYGAEPRGWRRAASFLRLDMRRGAAWIEGGWKVISVDGTETRRELYDVSLDPTERRDLWAERPVQAHYLLTGLRASTPVDARGRLP